MTHLIEEIFVFIDPHMSDCRKFDLKSALIGQSCVFWPAFVNFVISNHAQLAQSKDLAGTSPSSSASKALFLMALRLCGAFAEFIPLSLMIQTSFTQYLSMWLSNDERLFMGIVEVLNVLVKKSHGQIEEQIAIWRPIMDRFPEFLAFTASLLKNPFAGSNYELLKCISEFICEFGSHQLCARKSVLADEKSFSDYLKITLMLLGSDSDYISSMTISFWLNAFKQEKLYKHNTFFANIPQLITITTNKVIQFGEEHSFKNPSQKHFYEIDFDSEEEYAHFVSCAKSRYLDVLKGISRVKASDVE